MSVLDSKKAHYLVVPISGWGHLRPMLQFSLNLLTVRQDLTVTLLMDRATAPRLAHALACNLSGEDVLCRLKTKQIEEPAPTESEKADHLRPPKGGSTKEIIEVFQESDPPTLVIYNWLGVHFLDSFKPVINQLQLSSLPVYVFCPLISGSLYHFMAKKEHDGMIATFFEETEKLMDQGVEKYEAYDKTWYKFEDKIIHIPGYPPMKDWECFPQNEGIPFPARWSEFIKQSYDALSDPLLKGVLIPSAPELEGEPQEALGKDLGKRIIGIGPQFSADVWDGIPPSMTRSTPDEVEALDFLDEQLKLKGPRSVVYISFGSVFFPIHRPEIMPMLLKSLPSNMTFLLANAGDMSNLTPETAAEWVEGGRGKVVKFAPQWKVLNHPAIAWFISHMGINSSQESIMAGIPVVAFPQAADQNESAMLLGKLGTCIELQQLRTANGLTRANGTTIISTHESMLKEMHETWEVMQRDSDLMRQKAKEAREILVRSWKQGASRKNMEEFGR
ncbi:hypothetical protein M231_00377 [Tremella mesenterica]|uniref:UDP-glycosyltransferases domain-containing protein n=2 Tax=Tremella mesenterica TaxID=5217 RepID=A0A4V1M525_TREME|nr:hypothetical protein M231_00377 [Tremella mesenterica]